MVNAKPRIPFSCRQPRKQEKSNGLRRNEAPRSGGRNFAVRLPLPNVYNPQKLHPFNPIAYGHNISCSTISHALKMSAEAGQLWLLVRNALDLHLDALHLESSPELLNLMVQVARGFCGSLPDILGQSSNFFHPTLDELVASCQPIQRVMRRRESASLSAFLSVSRDKLHFASCSPQQGCSAC
jgi:hypothetical protein